MITFIGMPKAMREGKHAEDTAAGEAGEFMLVLDPDLRVKAATPSFYRAFQLSPEAVQNRPLHEQDHFVSDNPELQKALQKARQAGAASAPFTVELKMDRDARRKFECRLEPITLDGGAKVITLSLHATRG